MKRLILILIPAVVLASGIAWASMAVRMDLGQLTASADRVVVAQLHDQTSGWGPNHRRIYTLYRFSVLEDVAGRGEATLAILQPGGTVGRWTQVTSGFPRFERDEPVLLFLRKTGPNHQVVGPNYQVVGLCQGVFGLAADGDRELLVQRLEGLSFRGDPGMPIILDRRVGLDQIRSLWSGEGRP